MVRNVETTRMSSKGQVVLPSSIRHTRNWAAGTEFLVEETAEGILLKPVKAVADTQVEQVAGMLKSRRPSGRPPVSQADMDAAIAQEVQKRHARGRY